MRIDDLMAESGVTFGTSGARGLAVAMTDRVCYAYALGFMQHLRDCGGLGAGKEVGIAGDLRPSSERIMAACAAAVTAMGLRPRNFGQIPTPALAAFGIAREMPTMMVTGSHIPDDRNGIKFNTPQGEILKEDEAGIRRQRVALPADTLDSSGTFVSGAAEALPDAESLALDAYLRRYLDFFPAGSLAGVRVGLYEHSSVAREVFLAVLTGLGAEVTRLGRSEVFVPVDTEAIRPEDVALAREWSVDGRFDALVSADGDGDRPLVADAHGAWLRGDVAGILCARELGADGVVTPVSSNTAVERCGWFRRVERTRIGSPFVIAGMSRLADAGLRSVVGYEANGGFLTASDIVRDGCRLPALPTRDALIVAVTLLAAGPARGRPLSSLVAELPPRFTDSDRLKAFPTEISRARLAELSTGDAARDRQAVDAIFAGDFGPVAALDTTDGLRMTFASGRIAHLRPSGNAPELRAYTEADSAEEARAMTRRCLEILAGWREH
jgi:phosphomannomutase